MTKPERETRHDAPGRTIADVPLPFTPPIFEPPAEPHQAPATAAPGFDTNLERRSYERRTSECLRPGQFEHRISERRHAELLKIFGGRKIDP